jgi:hypothetical protein
MVPYDYALLNMSIHVLTYDLLFDNFPCIRMPLLASSFRQQVYNIQASASRCFRGMLIRV